MRLHAFLSAALFVALSAGCAVEADVPVDSEQTDDASGALSTYGRTMVGAYETAGTASPFDKLVLKSDGTYFADDAVQCITAPCNPIRQQGRFIAYRPQAGSTYGRLRLLRSDGSSDQYWVQLTRPNADFSIAKIAASTEWFRFTTVDSYCAAARDCAGQSYYHSMCAGTATCGAEGTCGWKCTSAPSDAQIKSDIEKAAEGVLFYSEADYGFTYVNAALSANATINEALVRAKLSAYVDNDEHADRPLSTLYGETQTFAEWNARSLNCDPENQADCDAQQRVNTALTNNLTDLKVFYFGSNGNTGAVEGIAVSIFIVGRTPAGNLAGVKTIAIWT